MAGVLRTGLSEVCDHGGRNSQHRLFCALGLPLSLPFCPLTCKNCSRGFTNTSLFSIATPGHLNSAGEKSPALADWPTALAAAQLHWPSRWTATAGSLSRLSFSEIIVLNPSAQASNPPHSFFPYNFAF